MVVGLEDTEYLGNGGGNIEPPLKKTVDLEKPYLVCTEVEYISNFIFNSYVITIFELLTLAMIRGAFLFLEQRLIFREEGTSNSILFHP